MKVVWTRLARERLREAALFIASDKPGAASRWVVEASEAAKVLRAHPRLDRVVPELDRDDMREILHGAYRLIYRIERARVVILTVRHGRRRLDPSELEIHEGPPVPTQPSPRTTAAPPSRPAARRSGSRAGRGARRRR